MKFAIFLSFFFATCCLIQAHNLKIKLVTVYDDLVATNGKVSLTLKGETSSKDLVFDKSEFTRYDELVLNTEFPEDVLSVVITWESNSNKPLLLLYLMIDVDNNEELVNFYVTKKIESGKPEEFKRN